MSIVHYGDNTAILATLAATDKKYQMCVTSPPYYGLRDYGVPATDWPPISYAPMPGLPLIHVPAMSCALGQEPTPEAFIGHLVYTFRLVREVLADDATLWLNLGDSYARSASKGQHKPGQSGKKHTAHNAGAGRSVGLLKCSSDGEVRRADVPVTRVCGAGLKEKDLIGIPWRAAFALQADGWYLRMDNIWAKKSCIPESVKDRTTKSHEYMFQLAKSEKYFFDHVAIEEAGAIPAGARGGKASKTRAAAAGVNSRPPEYKVYNGKRRKRSVWFITPARFSKAHFATFPAELVTPPILAGTSEAGHCPRCLARWVRQTEKETIERYELPPDDPRYRASHYANKYDEQRGTASNARYINTKTVGWGPSCACGLDPVPDIVLDPFGGSGTSAAVASKLGRDYSIIELNPDYQAFIDERIKAKK